MPIYGPRPFHCTKCDWKGNLMYGDSIETDSHGNIDGLECPACKSPVRDCNRLRPRNTTKNAIVPDALFAKLLKAYLFNVLSHVLGVVFLVVTVLPSFVIIYVYPGLLDNGYVALSLFVVQALFSSVSCVYMMRAYNE